MKATKKTRPQVQKENSPMKTKFILAMAIAIAVSIVAVAAQCAGTTKKGNPCKRQASAGSSYCWQHRR